MVTDQLDMTLAVDRAVKPQHKQANLTCLLHSSRLRNFFFEKIKKIYLSERITVKRDRFMYSYVFFTRVFWEYSE